MIGHPVGARIADNLSRLEQLFRLSTDALEQMSSNFEEAMGQGQFVFVPFNGFARTKVMADEGCEIGTSVSSVHSPTSKTTLFASQHLMAKQLLAQVCSIGENVNSLDLNSFTGCVNGHHCTTSDNTIQPNHSKTMQLWSPGRA
ncbi:hypothetical protein OS493_000863 [Desmophyllum pertusum]|uniref:Uncharacterized protein n=1 Tax=Desmophyllum pertusum TaxID=174260 RepID=A0A9W9ZTD1_9CNID|nr:hypothetical protein OS493_000863 [Desmophyllum pertusum]